MFVFCLHLTIQFLSGFQPGSCERFDYLTYRLSRQALILIFRKMRYITCYAD